MELRSVDHLVFVHPRVEADAQAGHRKFAGAEGTSHQEQPTTDPPPWPRLSGHRVAFLQQTVWNCAFRQNSRSQLGS